MSNILYVTFLSKAALARLFRTKQRVYTPMRSILCKARSRFAIIVGVLRGTEWDKYAVVWEGNKLDCMRLDYECKTNLISTLSSSTICSQFMPWTHYMQPNLTDLTDLVMPHNLLSCNKQHWSLHGLHMTWPISVGGGADFTRRNIQEESWSLSGLQTIFCQKISCTTQGFFPQRTDVSRRFSCLCVDLQQKTRKRKKRIWT